MNISIYDKAGEEIASVVVGSNSFVFSQIMGENYLQLEFKHGDYIDIRRDSYCIYGGVKYTLIQAVIVDKTSTVEYNYTARFEAPQELLKNIIMTHMAGEGQTLTQAYERNFSLAGTAREHVEMLLRNTGRLNANFSIGTIDTSLTGVKVVAYNVVDCKSALQLIANAFETEWWVEGNETNGYTVNLGKCSFSESNPTPIAYGYDNGVLGGAKRQLHKDAQRMTHIAVQGGSRNINTLSQLPNVPAYQFSTLHLPLLANAVDGVGTIYYDVKNNKFEGETGFVSANSVLLTIDRNANTMTSSLFTEGEDVVVERAYDLSEYYPQKTRKVTAFAFQRNNTEFYIEDSTIESACDYKAYQLGGEKITIVFQTGALAGKTFDVINYDHTNRRFECALADYDTISMPSVDIEMWRPVADSVYGGDEFIVYGTALPRTYFADTTTDPYSGAEWDMCRRTASILCENFNDKFSYSLPIDANWLSKRTEEERERLRCGFWVHFSDNQLCGGGEDIRITAVKQYLTKPLQPELTIGDEVKRVSVAQKLTQIESHVSATYNYVKTVEERTQQGLQLVEDTQSEIMEPSEDVQNYKGRITITDLLAIPVDSIGANDLYLVYSDGNEADGWSEGDTFTLDGTTYSDGTFFQFINGYWEAVDEDKEIDLSNYLRIESLPKTVYFIEGVNKKSSFDNLYGESKSGLLIATVGCYRLNDSGVYQQIISSKGVPPQPYYSENYTKSIYVPWARSYQQDGRFVYEGGMLTDSDYEKVMEGIKKGKDIFIAYYNKTTYREIAEAYEEGKSIVLNYNNGIIAVLGYRYGNEFRFYRVDIPYYNATATVTCFSITFTGGWDIPYNTTVENRGDRVPSSELSPSRLTDNKYLSALATKTLIEEYGGGVDIDTSIPQAPSDEHVPSTSLFVLQLATKQNTLTFDTAPTANSLNPVTSNGIKTALDGKQNTLTFDPSPTSGSTNPVTSGGVKTALDGKSDTNHTHSGFADTSLSNLSASAITNVKASGNRIATIGGVDIYETGREAKSTLDTSSSASYVAYDYVAGVYEIRSASLLWNWFRVNNNLPYFYGNHTQTPTASTRAGFYVGRDGVWWYDGMTTAIGWHKLVDDTQWQTSTSFVYKEDYVCAIGEATGTQMKLTVADFINSTAKMGRWFRYSLTFDGNVIVTGHTDSNWRHTNDNSEVAIFVYGKTNSTYASVDALYADFLQMEITASLFLTSQKKLIKDNIFSSIEVTTYTVSGVSVPAIKFAFNTAIIPKLWSTGAVPFTINIEAKRVGNI